MRPIWPTVRRVWITLGLSATAIFVGWSLWAYRATADARVASVSSAEVVVVRNDTAWYFAPRSPRGGIGLVFFPGALVDPTAYAPLLGQVAAAGYPALLVEVPRRATFGGADGPEVLDRAREAMRGVPDVGRWVVAGHSRGGVIAARAVHSRLPGIAGLVLIGTSHPRDFSLAHVTMPVTRIYGTRDTVADVEKLEANRHNLPASTRDVRIDGGNHSQFGSYRFQPGDWPATISRAEQQRLTVQGVLATLDQLVDGGIPPAAWIER
jgi:pimeloyl-ACP methyl ester carboxylesterase